MNAQNRIWVGAETPWWKYALDYGIGLPLCLLCLPVMLLVYLLVRVDMGRPVLFRQARPGLHGRTFILYKFRTMRDATDAKGRLLSDAERLTRLGRVLRATSLDELPELFNVLKGDMSLVGPRPLLTRYLPFYTQREMQRHRQKPGITGWAQINGRNTLAWDDRLAMDVWYVEHRSLWLDLEILAITVAKVLRRDGVSTDSALVETNLDEERMEITARKVASAMGSRQISQEGFGGQ